MSKIKIDENVVFTSTKDLVSANILTMTAGTNCPMGGDSGHGGRTYFSLEDSGGTCWSVFVDGKEISNLDKVEIVMKGDCECETLIQALASAAYRLRWQIKNNENKQ